MEQCLTNPVPTSTTLLLLVYLPRFGRVHVDVRALMEAPLATEAGIIRHQPGQTILGRGFLVGKATTLLRRMALMMMMMM